MSHYETDIYHSVLLLYYFCVFYVLRDILCYLAIA